MKNTDDMRKAAEQFLDANESFLHFNDSVGKEPMENELAELRKRVEKLERSTKKIAYSLKLARALIITLYNKTFNKSLPVPYPPKEPE